MRRIEQFGLVDGMNGLVITSVADYSDAARKGLLPGDVILDPDFADNVQAVEAAIGEH